MTEFLGCLKRPVQNSPLVMRDLGRQENQVDPKFIMSQVGPSRSRRRSAARRRHLLVGRASVGNAHWPSWRLGMVDSDDSRPNMINYYVFQSL